MNVFKYIVNIILSFLIMITILFVIAVNILNNNILNKDYIKEKMKETEFNVQISREVQSGFEKYIYQSGLPLETIENLFTQEMIQKDVDSILDFIYEGTEISLSSDTVRNNLDKKIQDYVSSQKINLNKQGKNNIKKFEDLIVKEYNNNVNASKNTYEQAQSTIEKIRNINNFIRFLPIILLSILIVILIFINVTDLLEVINFLGISLLSAGALIKIGISLIFSNIDIDNLVLISTSVSNLLINAVKEILYNISDKGNIFIVCGIVAILVHAIIKNVKTNK